MRVKNRHLHNRNGVWQLKVRIPDDVKFTYRGGKQEFIRESLKVRDVVNARVLRDARMRALESEWTQLRLAMMRRGKEAGDEAEQDHLMEQLETIPEDNPKHDLLLERLRVSQGKLTRLWPLCEDWLTYKGARQPKTLKAYRRALERLCEAFPYAENVDRHAARAYLRGLLQDFSKSTVEEHQIALRGVWEAQGWEPGVWSTKGMDVLKPAQKRKPFDDEHYSLLVAEASPRLALAIKLAAHTGASVQGLVRMELRDWDTDKPSLWLPETKTEGRPRLIPCLPELRPVAEEWAERKPKGVTLSQNFSRLKTRLGFGREYVFHGWRHSVVRKLEGAGADPVVISRVLGHKTGRITFDTYGGTGMPYERLREALRLIRWP